MDIQEHIIEEKKKKDWYAPLPKKIKRERFARRKMSKKKYSKEK